MTAATPRVPHLLPPVGRPPAAALVRAVAAAAMGAALLVVGLALSLDTLYQRPLRIVLVLWCTLPFIAAGLIAWRAAAGQPVRAGCSVAAGFVTPVSTLQWAAQPALNTVGQLSDLLLPALWLHVFLAHPTGRLTRRVGAGHRRGEATSRRSSCSCSCSCSGRVRRAAPARRRAPARGGRGRPERAAALDHRPLPGRCRRPDRSAAPAPSPATPIRGTAGGLIRGGPGDGGSDAAGRIVRAAGLRDPPADDVWPGRARAAGLPGRAARSAACPLGYRRPGRRAGARPHRTTCGI